MTYSTYALFSPKGSLLSSEHLGDALLALGRYNAWVPELPEVEVLAVSLRPHLVGRSIEDVQVHCADLRERVATGQLVRRCTGHRIVGVERRAKYLLLDLEGSDVLIVHLGMSGRLTLSSENDAAERHEHLSFGVSGGLRLRYRDPRRFGLVLVRTRSRLGSDRHFAHLGVEPLGAEFTAEFLSRAATGRRAPVKSFLMDGRVVVGVGNIYACEALHRAGIHPRRAAGRISPGRWGRLTASVVEVLAEAIRQGGTTLNDFTDGAGNPGYFQVALSVYDREGQECARCGSSIRRIVQGGRSTYYCPGCQR